MQPNLSINQKQDTEYEYANLSYSNHFLKGPEICICWIKSSLFKDLQTTKPMDAVSDVITINAENITPL